jgi:hypothetical protein
MNITREILDDWCGPDGYSDIKYNDPYLKIVELPTGNFALIKSSDGIVKWAAVEAKTGGHRGKLALIPKIVSQVDKLECLLNDIECHTRQILPDPEMDLDEIHFAQTLIQTD